MSRRTEAFARARQQATALLEDHPKLTDAVKDLDYCATDDRFRRAIGRLWDARAGLPGAAAYDGQPGGGSSESKVERLAMAGDPTDWDRDQFDHHLRYLGANLAALATDPTRASMACRSAYGLRRLVDVWGLTGRQANQRERAEVERVNRSQDDACAHHATWGTFEPTHRNGTVSGALPLPMPLCRWCYEQVRTNGGLPKADALERFKHRGKPDRVKVV